MKLNLKSIESEAADWAKANVALPAFDVASMRAATAQTPEWVHFGAGNIFRGFIGSLNQRLLNAGLAKTGILACETFDYDIIDRIYEPFDNLTLNVLMNPDGTVSKEVLAGIACGIRADRADAASMARLQEIFRAPSLKMISFTITEKGYKGPAMDLVRDLLRVRFEAGALPLAVVSMDNCSHNGEILKNAIVSKADGAFRAYLEDETKVTFPWSMIDKITPRPHQRVLETLKTDGIEGMDPIVTSRGTYIAPYVNAEKPQYLVIEDRFPNGRPALEKAGVYFTDRETVNKTEKMKVTTCLNPLHTSMAMFGCLLGYTLICEEMKDADIVALVKRLGYVEGLPVVVDPKILSPKAFIDEVVNERLPNVFMPDDPRRIATDTSQKVGIRFGETVKSYVREKRDFDRLVALPLALAAWMRYLLAVNDRGEAIGVSDDPLREELQAKLAGIVWDNPSSYAGQLRPILANASIFGSDLTETPLADRIEGFFTRMLAGPGSVRRTLHETVSGFAG